jgi:hypothetical protein
MYVHSRRDIEANGYLNCQWYDHIDIVKDRQPWDVASQDKVCNDIRKWAKNKQNESVVGQVNN